MKHDTHFDLAAACPGLQKAGNAICDWKKWERKA